MKSLGLRKGESGCGEDRVAGECLASISKTSI